MIRRSKSARERHVNAKHSVPELDQREMFYHPSNTFASTREVPPPLPRPQDNMALERPSTAGNMGSSHQHLTPSSFDTDARKLDKRVSRDDSWLAMRRTRPGYSTFADGPGRSSSPGQRRPTAGARMGSAPVLRSRMTQEDIGVALGSPTNPSAASSPWASAAPLQPLQEQPAPRKSSAKWKLFGMFGRKTSQPTIQTPPIADPNSRKASLPPEIHVERSNSIGRKRSLKKKPVAVRSQTMPEPGMRTREGWQEYDSTTIQPKSRPLVDPSSLVDNVKPSGPLLDVEIHNAPLERYSIMFGSVLSQQNQSSLLSRRQGNVQYLKVIDDTIEEEHNEQTGRPRRATSPDPTRTEFSNTYTLASTSANTRHLNRPHRLSPLARSSTSPAFIQAVSQNSSSTNKAEALSPAHGLETPQRRPPFSPDTSSLILESPVDMEDGSEQGDDAEYPPASAFSAQQAPNRAPPPPPSNELQAQAPSTASSSISSIRGGAGGRRSPSIASSSAFTHVTQPSPHQDETHQTSFQTPPLFCLDDRDNVINTVHMSPAELSIARQISVSRQQRNMLLQSPPGSSSPRDNAQGGSPRPRAATNPTHYPYRTTPKGLPGPNRRPSPHQGLGVVIPQKAQIGQSERMGETRSSTPTIVVPYADEAAGSGESPLAQHRKSSRIIFETA